jgi:hypothetical protein
LCLVEVVRGAGGFELLMPPVGRRKKKLLTSGVALSLRCFFTYDDFFRYNDFFRHDEFATRNYSELQLFLRRGCFFFFRRFFGGGLPRLLFLLLQF